tara:strand:- start:336 stop:656 length:321 start_codon:yes stop_codon:yes gene_type:complete
MNKSDIAARLIDRFKNIPEKDISDSVNLIIETMSKSLSNNQRIEIRGFGSFTLHYKAPRNAHNPKTGVKVITDAKYMPHFKPGKALKDRVNDSKDNVSIKNSDDAI